MKRLLIRITGIALIVYAGLCLAVFLFQRSFIYFPSAVPQSTPDALELQSGEATFKVAVRTLDVPCAIIYFGGNAEDVAYALDEFAAAFPDHALYMMYYRGYGGSAGRPTEAALLADAKVLIHWVRQRHSEITVTGRSIGSGIAVRLAASEKVDRLVLVTPFDSLVTLAKRQFPYLPVGALMLDKYESWRHAPKVTAPTRIIAAEHDEIVPLSSTQALFNAFTPGVAELRILERASHNDLSTTDQYPAIILSDPPTRTQ